jgi:acetolactate synthase-1/2/3 large subunit
MEKNGYEVRTGAESLVKTLEMLGVEYVFGYPGGAALPIFDALYDASFEFILVRHEQGATHMADGYARATGRPGVVLVTSGPGATNTLTGIYTAFMDSVPMVVLCGQVGRSVCGKDSFQEVNIFGMSMPIIKHSYSISNAEDIAKSVEEAWNIARSGRPGPVLLDLPKDVMAANCFVPKKFSKPISQSEQASNQRFRPFIDAEKVACFAEHLRRAKRPLLIAGHGVVIANADDELFKLATTLQLPVSSTLLGKGAFPETNSLSLGMLGMHGTAYANLALTRCDLVCSIGSRWDDRINGDNKNFCKGAVKLHIDIDEGEIDKVVKTDASLVGDAREILRLVNDYLSAHPGEGPGTGEWLDELDGYKATHPLDYSLEGGLKAQEVLEKVNELTLGQLVVTTDVGQHQMWAAQFLKFNRSFQWITSGGAGTMGFGFPAAIGCQLGRRDQMVMAVVGDGGFQMTFAELATAARYKLPIKILLLDNKYLGMVRQWQDIFYNNRLSGTDLMDNPNFVDLAQSFGVKGFHITKASELETVLQQALSYNEGPCLIHAEVEKQEAVYPMVPSGQAADKMILVAPKTNSMSVRPSVIPSPSVPAFQNRDREVSEPKDVFILQIHAASADHLFMRIAFVLSKKMYTLVHYEIENTEDRGYNSREHRIRIKISGSKDEVFKLVHLLKKIVGVSKIAFQDSPIIDKKEVPQFERMGELGAYM